jgi:phosphoribosylaminoimidazole (AIR) synthetase
MGIGMVLITAPESLTTILKFIRGQDIEVWPIGEVVKGQGLSRIV